MTSDDRLSSLYNNKNNGELNGKTHIDCNGKGPLLQIPQEEGKFLLNGNSRTGYYSCKTFTSALKDHSEDSSASPILEKKKLRKSEDHDRVRRKKESNGLSTVEEEMRNSPARRTTERTENTPLPESPKKSWFSTLDHTALGFGLRMGVCATTASLFVFIENPINGSKFPEGMWVLITILFVCWFPSLDAASVIEKSLQRIYGTLIGSSVALLCGLVSLAFGSRRAWKASFLAFCIFLYTFVICWAAVSFKVKGKKEKYIARYNYACILCLLTYYICLMPFYEEGDYWLTCASFRVLNVLIGCFLGALISTLVYPRSIVQILQRKMEAQIKLAGEASKAVMHYAADKLAENAYHPRGSSPAEPSIRKKITESRRPWRIKGATTSYDIGEEALEKHDSAIQESRVIKSNLEMLNYDPFQFGTPDEVIDSFRSEVANTLARALRIQHTVVLLDGIMRNDPKHDFSESQIKNFADIGTLIGTMLSVPLNDEAADQLLIIMAQVRQYIVKLAAVISAEETSAKGTPHRNLESQSSFIYLTELVDDDDDSDEDVVGSIRCTNAPATTNGSPLSALLFLQLVEHLALRSVRLYQSWKNCEHLCHLAAYREQSKESVRRLGSYYRLPKSPGTHTIQDRVRNMYGDSEATLRFSKVVV